MKQATKPDNLNRKDIPKPAVIAGMIVAAIGFALIWWAVENGATSGFDDPVREFFYGLRCPALNTFVVQFTHTGDAVFFIVLCILLLIWNKSRLPYGVTASACVLGITIINKLVKHTALRPRPEDIIPLVNEGGTSFASGHSAASMIFYGILIYMVQRNVKNRKAANILTVIMAIPMLLIGPSRVYVGVHYPTDVLGGWLLGIFFMGVAVLILQAAEKKASLRKPKQ
ncbi:MAG: phosphatase PAP2 family protein [Firmicutes bacterium]|nr:phosphatase PAP2 family protein [Bacillota bacterium]